MVAQITPITAASINPAAARTKSNFGFDAPDFVRIRRNSQAGRISNFLQSVEAASLHTFFSYNTNFF